MHKLIALICLVATLATAARAEDPYGNLARLDVLPGWRTPAGTHMTGVRITLAPGWKTYWRAPGDAGIPPHFDWDGSRNIGGARLHWPVPQVFRQAGMRSIGYHDAVVVPIELTPRTPGQPIHVRGTLQIGVCAEICVPVSLPFDAALPAEGRRDPAITAALINRPMTAAEGRVSHVNCDLSPLADGLQVTATLRMPAAGRAEDVVIEAGDPLVWVSEPAVRRDGGILTATAELVHAAGGGFVVDRSALRITVLGGDTAVDILGCPAG